MREKNKSRARIILIIALIVIAVFLAIIIVKLISPGAMAKTEDYIGQWKDQNRTDATLDLWDTDQTTFIGMCTFQKDSESAAFIDFEAVASRGGLEVYNCKRTDMHYDLDGNVDETDVYEKATGMIRRGADGTLTFEVEGDKDLGAFTFTLEGAY